MAADASAASRLPASETCTSVSPEGTRVLVLVGEGLRRRLPARGTDHVAAQSREEGRFVIVLGPSLAVMFAWIFRRINVMPLTVACIVALSLQ
jgi:hypothetical protein